VAKSRVFKKGASGDVEFNMTPLIDCTFQLIIFFILTSAVLSKALAPVRLHRPLDSQALEPKEMPESSNRTIVNVVSMADVKAGISPRSAQAKEYKILGDSIDVGDRAGLIRVFKAHQKKAKDKGFKDFYVEIRADDRVNFGAVRPVMLAAARAGIPRMNITALTYVPGGGK
jgi:biopolymer transport protein ExbD